MFGTKFRMALHKIAGRAVGHAVPIPQRYHLVNRAAGLFSSTSSSSFTFSPPLRAFRNFPKLHAQSRAPALHHPRHRHQLELQQHAGSRRRISSDSSSSTRGWERGLFSRQREEVLEARANAAGNNPLKEERYLRELNASGKPEAVVDRVHSGSATVTNPGVALEYVKALVRTDRMDQATLQHVLQQAQRHHHVTGFGADRAAMNASVYANDPLVMAAQQAVASAGGGAPTEPFLVKIAPKSFGETLLGAAATIIAIVAVLVIVQNVMDSSSRRGGISSLIPGLGNNAGKIATREETTFDDVKGVTEAKAELVEVVEFLKSPDRFTKLGGKLPRGVLLTGPPGTGKTLLAKAVAGEAGVPFFFASGSEFEEVFVGLGARRVRQLFETAKENAPCILFIDEIDAIGQKRSGRDLSSNRQTINQLLSELDGFEGDCGVIIIAATNFSESLDPALTRPGRFDRNIHVTLPDLQARTDILDLYLDKCPVDESVDAAIIARGTPGASGADLANVVNMAAVQASVEGCETIAQTHLEWAKDKMIMGPERTSSVMRPEDLRCTAYHETGHALVALLTPGSYPVHKATIMPRGQALGMVSQLPEHDVVSMSRKQIHAKLDTLMGGRVAEEVFFGEENVTTGAASDMQQATNLAYRMVTQYGMTEAGGLMYLDQNTLQNMSPEHRAVVDKEVKRILDEAYQRAKQLITSHKATMHRVAKTLLERETLTGQELKALL